MDWKGCELVEEVPGKCSGRPVIVGTRIFPETLVHYAARGASVHEMLEDFPCLTVDVIDLLLAFEASNRRQLAS